MIKERKEFIDYKLGDKVVLADVDDCYKWVGQRQYLGKTMTIASKVTCEETSSICEVKVIKEVDFTFFEDEEKFIWSYNDIDHEKTKELSEVRECLKITRGGKQGYKINEFVEGVEYVGGLYLYKIENGKLYSKIINSGSHFTPSLLRYNEAISMEFMEMSFVPKIGETYYFPSFSRSGGYDEEVWSDDGFDMRVKSNIGIFRTIKQAQMISLTNGWIDEHELIEEEI